jgi:S1-C subfamily serine protease
MKRNFFRALIVVLVIAFTLSITPILAAEESTSGGTADAAMEFGKNYQFSAADQWLLVQPAICYITTVYYAIVYDPNFQDYSANEYIYGPFGGTGFVVNPDNGTIVTAGHMVDAREADEVNLKYTILDQYIFETYPDDYYNLTQADWNWIYENYKVVGYNVDKPEMEVWVQFNTAVANVPDNPGNTFIRAEVVEMSTRNQRDIAILRIAPVTGRALSSAIIGDSSMVSVGDQVTIIGYPWTSEIGQDNPLNPTVTQGNISGKVMLAGTEVLQVQGDARPGNSGGPVLGKEDGKIIGILTMGTDDTNNYLRPANDVKMFLNTENKLGQVDLEWKTGLAMFQENHYSEAMKHFDAALNLSAGHLLAQEYKAKAQANMGNDVPFAGPETAPETSQETVAAETSSQGPVETAAAVEKKEATGGLPMWAIIVIAVVGFLVIVLIVVIIIVVMRRKPPVATAAQPVIAQPPAPPQIPKESTKDVKKNFCPSCGSPVQEGATFCPSCGKKLAE